MFWRFKKASQCLANACLNLILNLKQAIYQAQTATHRQINGQIIPQIHLKITRKNHANGCKNLAKIVQYSKIQRTLNAPPSRSSFERFIDKSLPKPRSLT